MLLIQINTYIRLYSSVKCKHIFNEMMLRLKIYDRILWTIVDRKLSQKWANTFFFWIWYYTCDPIHLFKHLTSIDKNHSLRAEFHYGQGILNSLFTCCAIKIIADLLFVVYLTKSTRNFSAVLLTLSCSCLFTRTTCQTAAGPLTPQAKNLIFLVKCLQNWLKSTNQSINFNFYSDDNYWI